jgi:hypothetical protein
MSQHESWSRVALNGPNDPRALNPRAYMVYVYMYTVQGAWAPSAAVIRRRVAQISGTMTFIRFVSACC